MRSTITIDSVLLEELKKESGSKSKTNAVILAIQDFLRRRKVGKIKSLKGKMHFTMTAKELRHYER